MEWSGPRLAHFQLQNNKRFHPKSQTSTMAVGIDVRRWHGRQRTTGGERAFVESPLQNQGPILCRRPLAERRIRTSMAGSDVSGFRMAIWAQNPGEEESGVEMFHRRTRPKCCRVGNGRLIGSAIGQRNTQLVAVWAAKLEVPSVHGPSAAPMGTKMRTGNYHLGGGRGSREGWDGGEERERNLGEGR